MYDFRQLSPVDFEELTRDLLQKEWSIPLESFKSGRDQGIDLRYSKARGKRLIVQCKRFVDSDISDLLSHLKKSELPKIRRLAPSRYVLVTALPLSPADKDKILKLLSPFVKRTGDILGSEDVNNLLGRHPGIETQHFKLWLSSTAVLDRVLRNAERVQTDFDVDRVRRSIPLYVQNRSYTKALEILEEQNFVIVSGVPGIGKTTLADMLLYAHLEASFEPVVIQFDISEARGQVKPDRKQIFYFDDFLGQTFLGNRFDFLGRKEDAAVLDFMSIIANSKTSRLVLTTREHILQHAFQISERFQREQFNLIKNRCVLELKSYSLSDRARILYNHIFFSELPPEYRSELLRNKFYMEVLKHRNFNPRLVEWLSRYANVRSVSASRYREEVMRVLENPAQLWKVAFEQQISDASRSVLLALYSLGGEADLGALEEAWRVLHHYRSKKYNWSLSPEDWRRSLRDLEGGFLSFEKSNVSFINPSVNDFFDSVLDGNSDHMSDLLETASTFSQVARIWSLSRSEKGENAGVRLDGDPSLLLEVLERNLRRPHQKEVRYPGGGKSLSTIDMSPEGRVTTVVAIADRTHSAATVEVLSKYVEEMLSGWEKRWFDYDEALKILSILDTVSWRAIVDINLGERIRCALLADLREHLDGAGILAVVSYAIEQGSTWPEEDGDRFKSVFEAYLEEQFSDEVAHADDDHDLARLSTILKLAGSFCDVDVDGYQEQIDERSAEFSEPEDDDHYEPRGWSFEEAGSSEAAEEAEVDRLFGGLNSP